jgi:hypothetical protein
MSVLIAMPARDAPEHVRQIANNLHLQAITGEVPASFRPSYGRVLSMV